jgi:3-dehydroquinate synthase II
MKKTVWIRADIQADLESRKDIVRASLENGLFDLVVNKEDIERLGKLGRFNTISMNNGILSLKNKHAALVEIGSKEDENKVKDLIGRTDYVVVSPVDWKVIPLENLIASFHGSETKLIAEVSDATEAALFMETLEKGVDGIVLRTDDCLEVTRLKEMLAEMEEVHLELQQARITELRPVGTGDRVCIDTCSILEEGEGMLVGSGSSGMFLVHSESLESEYVDSRPFRVNAGSVHSYVCVPAGKPMYLSDLEVGNRVLAVNKNGNTRPVTVGRLKIERRPLLKIEAETEDGSFNIIVQNAETVRLISEGRPKSIVDLEEGIVVLIRRENGGRHFGMKIEENIVEK